MGGFVGYPCVAAVIDPVKARKSPPPPRGIFRANEAQLNSAWYHELYELSQFWIQCLLL